MRTLEARHEGGVEGFNGTILVPTLPCRLFFPALVFVSKNTHHCPHLMMMMMMMMMMMTMVVVVVVVVVNIIIIMIMMTFIIISMGKTECGCLSTLG